MLTVIKSAVWQVIVAIWSIIVYSLKTTASVHITETASLNSVKIVYVVKKWVRAISPSGWELL